MANQDEQAGGDKGVDTKAGVVITKPNYEESFLNPQVQTLVNFFLNEKLMEASMVSVNVDVKRMPLGQLSKETVLKGYSILCNIEKAI